MIGKIHFFLLAKASLFRKELYILLTKKEMCSEIFLLYELRYGIDFLAEYIRNLLVHLHANLWIHFDAGNVQIISYCDRSKSAGQGYLAMGFKFDRVTNPGYFWTEGNEVISRHKCNHKNLQKWLIGYDSTLTEFENMYNAKYRCYWDCGNFVFTL